MARDKFYEERMRTMIHDYNLVKEEGLEALEKEIKRRGITKLPLSIKSSKIDELLLNIKENLKNNLVCSFLWVMHADYGFGKKRLTELMENVNKAIDFVFDLDYMGEHYVRLEDYAIEIKQKFGFDIDIDKVASATAIFDERDCRYHMLKTEKVIEELKSAGFEDAAKFLEAKLD
jgi:hypothetical protein